MRIADGSLGQVKTLNRKEVNTVKYHKPEVELVATAVRAIESVESKHISPLMDSFNQTPDNTGPAYEADE